MILESDTVPDPRAVVVEFGDTFVAEGAVLGSNGFTDETRGTEPGRIKALPFGQLDDRLLPLFLTDFDVTGITSPRFVEVVVESTRQCDEADREQRMNYCQ